jgi:hypothetical protein
MSADSRLRWHRVSQAGRQPPGDCGITAVIHVPEDACHPFVFLTPGWALWQYLATAHKWRAVTA